MKRTQVAWILLVAVAAMVLMLARVGSSDRDGTLRQHLDPHEAVEQSTVNNQIASISFDSENAVRQSGSTTTPDWHDGVIVRLAAPSGTPTDCVTSVEILESYGVQTTGTSTKHRIVFSSPIVDIVHVPRADLKALTSVRVGIRSNYLFLRSTVLVDLAESKVAEVALKPELGGMIVCDLNTMPIEAFPMTVYAADVSKETAFDALMGPHSQVCGHPSTLIFEGLPSAIYELGLQARRTGANRAPVLTAEQSSSQSIRLAPGAKEYVSWPTPSVEPLSLAVMVMGSNGQPVRGAAVYGTTHSFSNSSRNDHEVTDDTGTALLELCASAGVALEVRADDTSPTIQQFVAIAPGAREATATVIAPMCELRGRVVGPNGVIPGASVRVDPVPSPEEGNWIRNSSLVLTNEAGEFMLPFRPCGECYVRIGGFSEFPQGAAENQYGLLVARGEATTNATIVDYNVGSATDLNIVLATEDNAAPRGGRVYIQPATHKGPYWQDASIADGSARYVARYLSPGAHRVAAQHQDAEGVWYAGTIDVYVGSTSAVPILLPLTKAAQRVVRCPAPDGKPRLFQMCVRSEEEVIWPGQVGQGSMRSEHVTPPLPPGRYNVHCWTLDGDYLASAIILDGTESGIIELKH